MNAGRRTDDKLWSYASDKGRMRVIAAISLLAGVSTAAAPAVADDQQLDTAPKELAALRHE